MVIVPREIYDAWSHFSDLVGEPAVYESLAEECSELAKAAQKMARALRKENPTPVTEEEAKKMVDEEFTDVFSVAIALDLRPDVEISQAKWDRLLSRIEEKEKQMTKVFISQPMKGLSDAEILEDRNRAIAWAKEKYGEVKILESFFQGAPVEAKPLWFLGESLKVLADADVAIFLPGYDMARGCKIELACAMEYGITTVALGEEDADWRRKN